MRGQRPASSLQRIRAALARVDVSPGKRMARRIILCDGLASARLWGLIGTQDDEVLTWIPRRGESRSRPPGFHVLQGGLCTQAIGRLNPKADDAFAVVSDEVAFARAAVAGGNMSASRLPTMSSSRRQGMKSRGC